MSPLVQMLVFGVLVPGGVAAVAALAARPWRDAGDRGRIAAVVAGPAVAFGYVPAHWQLAGDLELVPLEIWNWMPHLVLVAALASVLAARAPRPAVWALRAMVSLGAAYLLLRPQLDHQLIGAIGAAAVGGSAVILLVEWSVLERVVERESPRVGAGLLVVIVGASAGLAAASGTLRIGQLGGAAAAAIGGVCLVGFVFRNAALVRGLVAAAAMLFWAPIVLAFFYAFMHPPVVAELVLLPVLVHIVQIAARSRRKAAVVARFGTAVAIAALAALTAFSLDRTDSGTDTANDYGYQ